MHGYAGNRYNDEIQQHYLIASYYHPAYGVFTYLDPDPEDEEDPLTINGYTYSNSNSVNSVDPYGYWVWFTGYDAYKTYKKTKSLKNLIWQRRKVQQPLWSLVVLSKFSGEIYSSINQFSN